MGADMYNMSDRERRWMDENALASRTKELKNKYEFIWQVGGKSKGVDVLSSIYNHISIEDAEALLKFQIDHDDALTRHPFNSFKVKIGNMQIKYKNGQHHLSFPDDDFLPVDLGKLLQLLRNAIYGR